MDFADAGFYYVFGLFRLARAAEAAAAREPL
jgi:hypothetical protein